MANTVIQLKHSSITGNVPSSLANGEISINSRDGKFFYSTPAGVVTTHYPYLGPAGLNKEVQFNDSGTLGSNSGLTFDKTTGVFNAPIVASSNNGNGTNFKVGDDAWIGDVNIADTLRISGQQNVNNAYIVFGATNANTLGRAGSGPLTYTGDFKATGLVSGNELTSTQSSGNEGGQVNLSIPATGTSLLGSVTIDVFQNRLRFFQGDSAKGAYIDLTAAASGVGTDLLAASTSTDGWARGQANASFATANSAASYANSAFAQANSASGAAAASSYANSAFAKANTAQSTASSAASAAAAAQSTADAAYNTNDFASIYTPNNSVTVTASARNDTFTIVGESGVAVWGNSGTKTIAIAGTPGAQGLTVDYGFVADPLYYAIDYGTL